MLIEVLKSKIHRIKVTDGNLDYIGSLTLDIDLMEKVGLVHGEKIQVLNVNNGEIIALASLPNFDPNTVNKLPSLKTADQRFNRALQGSYELGSVMKIFTLAMALEEEKVNLSISPKFSLIDNRGM